MAHSEMLPVPATRCPFPLSHPSPLFPNRMFRLSCVTLTRKRAMSSWPTESQPKQRFVTYTRWKKKIPQTISYQQLHLKCERAVLDLLQEYLPADIQAQFSTSRELIRNIHNSFHKLRDRAEKMAERSKENATDLLMFGRELRYFIIMGIKSLSSIQCFWMEKKNVHKIPNPWCCCVSSWLLAWNKSAPEIKLFVDSTLGSDASSLPSLASSQSTWGTLRQALKSLSVEFAVLSDKAAQQVQPSVLHHLLCCTCKKKQTV